MNTIVGFCSQEGNVDSDEGFLPTNWSISFENNQQRKVEKLLKRGNFIIFRGLPASIDYNPNGIWFACTGEYCGVRNTGATYKCPTDTDFTMVGFRCQPAALFSVEDLEANSTLSAQRSKANKERVRAERADTNASALSFHHGWHSGITHFGANSSGWNVCLDGTVPGNLVWGLGDMIKVQGAGVQDGCDPNNIWFSCTYVRRSQLTFSNPGVQFSASAPETIKFTARALNAFTAEELAENDRLVAELIRPEGNELEARRRRSVAGSIVPPSYIEAIPAAGPHSTDAEKSTG